MKQLTDFLGNPFSQALAWALLHFLWQGALVAFGLAGLLALLPRAKAQTRYLLACAALAAMFVLPALTLRARLGSPAGILPDAASESSMALPSAPSAARDTAQEVFLNFAPPAESAWARSRFAALQPWLVSVWLLGVCLLSIRFLGGWAAVERLRRVKTRPAASDRQAALNRLAARLSVTRPVRLLLSAAVQVPSALGVWKPAVLLPASALTGLTPRQLEAILAHELAHIRRHDYLVNLLQTTVETLLFYHPAVWWVSRRVRVERENCCDDLAVAATGSARVYARALADLEEMRLGALALAPAANGGALWQRVSRLLGSSDGRPEGPSRSLAGALTLIALLGMGAAFRYSVPGEEASPLLEASYPVAATESTLAEERHAPQARANPKPVLAPRAQRSVAETDAVADRSPDSLVVAAGSLELADAIVEADPDEENTSQEKAKGAKRPIPLDQIIAFKVHGVTPEFVAEIASLGYTRVDPDALVSLRVHGIDAEYIRKTNAQWGRRDLDQIVSLKIHGVTTAFADQMKTAGFTKLDVDDLVSMKVHGVTPEFVRSARAAWPGPLDADDVVSLRIHGVVPQDAEKWKALGFAHPTLDELTSLRIHGVTPEFAREVIALGVTDLDLDQIVAFKIHGVTSGAVNELRGLGYKSLSAEDVLSAKIHGVSAADIRAYRAAGYPDLTLEDAANLKNNGISPQDLEEMNRK